MNDWLDVMLEEIARKQREARQMENFYCNSGPVVQAAMELFFGIEAECPDKPEKPGRPPRPSARSASPVVSKENRVWCRTARELGRTSMAVIHRSSSSPTGTQKLR